MCFSFLLLLVLLLHLWYKSLMVLLLPYTLVLSLCACVCVSLYPKMETAINIRRAYRSCGSQKNHLERKASTVLSQTISRWKYTNQNVVFTVLFCFFSFCVCFPFRRSFAALAYFPLLKHDSYSRSRCMCCCCSFLCLSLILHFFLVSLFIKRRRGMNVNAVWALVAFTAKKSMLVHHCRVPTMAFVLIYLKDMMAIHTSVYALTVSIYLRAFCFFPSFFFFRSFAALPFHSCTFINSFSIYIHSIRR